MSHFVHREEVCNVGHAVKMKVEFAACNLNKYFILCVYSYGLYLKLIFFILCYTYSKKVYMKFN